MFEKENLKFISLCAGVYTFGTVCSYVIVSYVNHLSLW